MARRRRRKLRHTSSKNQGIIQFHLKSHIVREIWAVLYIALGVLTFLSIRDELGILGQVVKQFLLPVAGVGIYILPVVFFVVAAILFLSRTINFGSEKVFGVLLFLLSVLGTVHLSVPFEDAYSVAKLGQAGGYIGFVGSFLMISVLGVIGAYVVFFALFIISVLLVFEVSLMDLVEFINSIHLRRGRSSRHYRDEELFQDAAPDELNIVRPSMNRSDHDDVVVLKELGDNDVDAVDIIVDEDERKVLPKAALSKRHEKASASSEEGGLLEEEDYIWEYLPYDLLDDQMLTVVSDEKLLKRNAEKIKEKLAEFDIKVTMQDVHIGPTVMQYTLKPDEGVKLSKIKAFKDDFALALAAPAIRIEAPIPGRSLVGIEVPNMERAVVHLREILESPGFKMFDSKLALPIGRDVSGKPVIFDLVKMPHLLIAGATGAGKSICLNTFLVSFLLHNSPKELRVMLIDPKRVELSSYNAIPHLLTPVITEPDKAAIGLRWAVAEMNRRYRIFAEKGCRSIDEYNKDERVDDKMFKILVMIDELADLMMVAAKEVEASICRIAQMARAVGIHLIVATQRPSVDVITGLIKANIPARIAFTTASSIDSRTILDTIGAEDLLGQGDLLFLSGTMSRPIRVQGIYISSKEIERVTNRLKLMRGPSYHEDITSAASAETTVPGLPMSKFQESIVSDDDLYESALALVMDTHKASASLLQRHLKVGYARAARLLDEMEQNGIVGPVNGAKPRKVLVE